MPLSLDKMQKTGHKSAPGIADKLLCIPGTASRRPGSAPLPHPGLYDGYTRVSSGLSKPFLTKEKPVLMKKEAVLTGFVPVLNGPCFYRPINTQHVIVFYHDGYDR